MPDQHTNQYAIPLLPCMSINQTEDFYKALGAVVTYKQKVPNNYIAFNIWDLELHFFALKQQPDANYSGCYLIVTEIDPIYEVCRASLKSLYGKVPLKGYPRLNPLKDIPAYGVRQFIVVDPNGNYIRVGQRIEKTNSLVFPEKDKPAVTGTPLAKVYELGSRLADAHGDFETAAKVLDKALLTAATNDPLNLLKVLILRADIAARLADANRFNELMAAAEKQLLTLPVEDTIEQRRLLDELKNI
ncbi:hypothetical protein [Longitalea luteola]|uniref:hypothetical protein n=1 Tax=Longitalea luteola TaxID=2812563 RepID=UPI001A96BA3D|nr:hypothetical protein [Longitalea luteola]